MNLTITDNPEMMTEIARDIVKQKSDYYTDEVLNGIGEEIRHHIDSTEILGGGGD